jgi:hypothetical protein
MIFIEEIVLLILVTGSTPPATYHVLVVSQPGKRRQDRRTPNYVSQSRSLYQAPAKGRNQGRPL